jgi:hypothetical protein
MASSSPDLYHFITPTILFLVKLTHMSVEKEAEPDNLPGEASVGGAVTLNDAPSNDQMPSEKKPWNASGYKGVVLHKPSGRLTASIVVRGTSHYLGLYRTPEEAAAVYNRAATQYFGDAAILNDLTAT